MTLQRATCTIQYPPHLGARALDIPLHPLRETHTPFAQRQIPWRIAASGQERLNLLRLSGIPGVLISAATGVPGERTEKMARVEAALLVADRPLSLRNDRHSDPFAPPVAVIQRNAGGVEPNASM